MCLDGAVSIISVISRENVWKYNFNSENQQTRLLKMQLRMMFCSTHLKLLAFSIISRYNKLSRNPNNIGPKLLWQPFMQTPLPVCYTSIIKYLYMSSFHYRCRQHKSIKTTVEEPLLSSWRHNTASSNPREVWSVGDTFCVPNTTTRCWTLFPLPQYWYRSFSNFVHKAFFWWFWG